MSYMRSPYPLRHFRDYSRSYVFGYSDHEIEDYGDKYENNPSLIELLGTFIRRSTGDKTYAEKMMRILAGKLNCLYKWRDCPLTDDEDAIEQNMLHNAFEHGGKALNALEWADQVYIHPGADWLEKSVANSVCMYGHMDRDEAMEFLNELIFKGHFSKEL